MAHLSFKFAITNRSHEFWERITMGVDRERITWLWEGIHSWSPPDPLPIPPPQSLLYSEPLIGLDRSHSLGVADLLPMRARKINKFLTFDSISTSDESGVLKTLPDLIHHAGTTVLHSFSEEWRRVVRWEQSCALFSNFILFFYR